MTSPASARRERSKTQMPESPHGRKSTSPSSAQSSRPPRSSRTCAWARLPSTRASSRPLFSGSHARAQSTGPLATVDRPSPRASSEPPPAAITTALAVMPPACGAPFSPGAAGEKKTFQSPAAGATDVTLRAGASVTPARRARARRTFLTEAAWRESG